MVRGGEVEVNLLYYRLGRVGKVDEDKAAHRRGHLIHQAAGLTEVDVLRILSDLCDLHRGELPIAEQIIDDGADQHLEGCRGTQAAAREDGRMRLHLKSMQDCAALGKTSRNTPDQCNGRVLLFRVHLQIIQINAEAGITLGEDRDRIFLGKRNIGYSFKVNCGCKDAAVLVIGVIAADFSAAGCGVGKVLSHEYTPSYGLLLF